MNQYPNFDLINMSNFYNHKLIKIIKSITKYSCPKSINFHLHSTYSDGSLTAIEIYKQAIEPVSYTHLRAHET